MSIAASYFRKKSHDFGGKNTIEVTVLAKTETCLKQNFFPVLNSLVQAICNNTYMKLYLYYKANTYL